MFLSEGDTVIIVSPSGRVLNENIDNASQVLQSWGLNVLISPSAKEEFHNFSGTKQMRLDDLQWALNHGEAKAIFASRGGYGAIHLLEHIDWSLFRQKPKMLIGYSDICNLHAQINKLNITSIHGLMPNSFPPFGKTTPSLDTLHQLLFHPKYSLQWQSPISVNDFELEGELVGGNLSILYSLQGTNFAPFYKDKILFIEDLSEYVYHIDRILNNFDLSGVLSNVKAIVVGDFTNIKDNDSPFGNNVSDIINELALKNNTPVCYGLKVGHDTPTLALPFSRNGVLNVKDNKCSLSF